MTQHLLPARRSPLYSKLVKVLEEAKHNDTRLLHWDKRAPSQVLDRCDTMHRTWTELPATYKGTMHDFKRNKLYTLVFASNKFEGSKISEGETMRLLRTWGDRGDDEIRAELANTPRQIKRNEPPVHREVLQHFLAANFLCEKLPTPLTEELIKNAHGTLMDGLLDNDRLGDVPHQKRICTGSCVHSPCVCSRCHETAGWRYACGCVMSAMVFALYWCNTTVL
jgi:hypothetical protein